MKILHYIPSIDRSSGGVGGYLQLLAHNLGKIAELHIVSHHSANELSIDNAIIHYVDGDLFHLYKSKKQFVKLLAEIKPDVVHVNSCWEVLSSYTVFWAKSLHYPVLITTHGMLEPWVLKKNYWKKKLPALLLYQKKALQMADMLIATAESEQKNLLQLGYNLNVKVVPNSVIIDDIPFRTDWNSHNVIFFLALLRPNKGADLLIKAVWKLKEELKGYKVIIGGFGDSDYIETLKRLIEDLGLERIVSLPGGIYDEEKWEYYRMADVFVLPTLNENFGIVIAESLASGTPVITTKGAPWEDIVNWNCGWWIDRDIEHLVKALREFLALSTEQRARMGHNGRRLVEEKYSSRKMAEDMLGLYAQVIPTPHLEIR